MDPFGDAKPFMIFPDNLSPAKEVQSSRVGFDAFKDNHSNQNDNAHENKAEMKKASLTVFKEKSALHKVQNSKVTVKVMNKMSSMINILIETLPLFQCFVILSKVWIVI